MEGEVHVGVEGVKFADAAGEQGAARGGDGAQPQGAPAGNDIINLVLPMGRAAQEPPFDRRVTDDEYAAALSWMQLCGLETGFLQEPDSADRSYIPEFNFEGLDTNV